MAVAHDGQATFIANGRLLRSKRRYQNMLKGKLSARLDRKKKGSRRKKRLIRSKRKQLEKMNHQIKDVLHKQTSRLITTLHKRGVQTLVIGDVREIRQDNDKGHMVNQKIHQWAAGKTRFSLSYKAERHGMQMVLQEESYTSKTCPACGKRCKRTPTGRVFTCTNKNCRWSYHRDGVGAIGIRAKYRGNFGRSHVVGDMAPPIGLRFFPHVQCSSLPLTGAHLLCPLHR